MKKIEFLYTVSDFEEFVNRKDINVLQVEIKGVESSVICQKEFIGIVFYEDSILDKNLSKVTESVSKKYDSFTLEGTPIYTITKKEGAKQWNNPKENLPKTNRSVLLKCKRESGEIYYTIGQYLSPVMTSNSSSFAYSEEITYYDEYNNKYCLVEGWYCDKDNKSIEEEVIGWKYIDELL